MPAKPKRPEQETARQWLEMLILRIQIDDVSEMQWPVVQEVLDPYYTWLGERLETGAADILVRKASWEPKLFWHRDVEAGVRNALEVTAATVAGPRPRADGRPLVELRAGLAYATGYVLKAGADLEDVVPGGIYGDPLTRASIRATQIARAAPDRGLLVDEAARARFPQCFPPDLISPTHVGDGAAWLTSPASLLGRT
jgi:hypothetical protein